MRRGQRRGAWRTGNDLLAVTEVADVAAFLAACRQIGEDTVFDAGGEGIDTTTLEGVRLSDLGAADLLLA